MNIKTYLKGGNVQGIDTLDMQNMADKVKDQSQVSEDIDRSIFAKKDADAILKLSDKERLSALENFKKNNPSYFESIIAQSKELEAFWNHPEKKSGNTEKPIGDKEDLSLPVQEEGTAEKNNAGQEQNQPQGDVNKSVVEERNPQHKIAQYNKADQKVTLTHQELADLVKDSVEKALQERSLKTKLNKLKVKAANSFKARLLGVKKDSGELDKYTVGQSITKFIKDNCAKAGRKLWMGKNLVMAPFELTAGLAILAAEKVADGAMSLADKGGDLINKIDKGIDKGIEKAGEIKDKVVEGGKWVANKGAEGIEAVDRVVDNAYKKAGQVVNKANERADLLKKIEEGRTIAIEYNDGKGNKAKLYEVLPEAGDKKDQEIADGGNNKHGKEYIMEMEKSNGVKDIFGFNASKEKNINREEILMLAADKENRGELQQPGVHIGKDPDGKVAVFYSKEMAREQEKQAQNDKIGTGKTAKNLAGYATHNAVNAARNAESSAKNTISSMIKENRGSEGLSKG